MDLGERGRCSMYWIHLAQGRDHCRTLVNEVIDFQVP
jgi:hypothetical protein